MQMIRGSVTRVAAVGLLSLIAFVLVAALGWRELRATRQPQLVRIIDQAAPSSRDHSEDLARFVQELDRTTLRDTEVRTAMQTLLQKQKQGEWQQFVGDAIEAVVASGRADDHEVRTYLEQMWRLRFRPEYAVSSGERVLILPEWELLGPLISGRAWFAGGYGAYERGLALSVEEIRVDGEPVELPSMTTYDWLTYRPTPDSSLATDTRFCVPGMMYYTSPLRPRSALITRLLNAEAVDHPSPGTMLFVPYVTAGERGTRVVQIRWRLRVSRSSDPELNLSQWDEVHAFTLESTHSLVVR